MANEETATQPENLLVTLELADMKPEWLVQLIELQAKPLEAAMLVLLQALMDPYDAGMVIIERGHLETLADAIRAYLEDSK